MARLTASARKRIKKGNFALPKTRAYPIEDENHAKNALARVSQYGTNAQKATVRKAVKKKYPSMRFSNGQDGWTEYNQGMAEDQ